MTRSAARSESLSIRNPRLTRVWLGANDPKDRLPFLGQVFFVVCLLVVVGVFAPQTKEEPSEQTDSTPEQAASISPLQTQGVEDQWQVHEFEIFNNTDFSFVGRSRRRIHVLAPTATTREDRIATFVDAVAEFYREDYPDFISAMLFGGSFQSESGGYSPIAMIDYVPDGCGLSGDDCRGEDTKRNLKHAKRLRRSYVPGCGAAEIDLDRGSAMFPSGNRR